MVLRLTCNQLTGVRFSHWAPSFMGAVQGHGVALQASCLEGFDTLGLHQLLRGSRKVLRGVHIPKNRSVTGDRNHSSVALR